MFWYPLLEMAQNRSGERSWPITTRFRALAMNDVLWLKPAVPHSDPETPYRLPVIFGGWLHGCRDVRANAHGN